MRTYQLTTLILCLMMAISCGGQKQEPETTEKPATPEESMAEAMKEAQKAMENANLEQPVEPVNFRKLKELLPQELAGYSLENASGETAGAMNMKISNAKGKYRNSGKEDLVVEIMDTGGFGMGAMSMATWSTVTIDREDDMGYERTGSIGGYKSYERYRNDGSKSNVSVLAEKRFIVDVSCRGCKMEVLHNAIKDMNLSRFKGLE
ncbi:MAG: hypothetical protein R3A50_12315 [Saprospiraceae bacterium]